MSLYFRFSYSTLDWHFNYPDLLCFLSFLQANYKWATTGAFRIFPDSVFVIVMLLDINL